MSRRPRLDPMSVAMGGLSRMNSNGRTLPSEAPVQRPILTVQARAAAGVGTYIPGVPSYPEIEIWSGAASWPGGYVDTVTPTGIINAGNSYLVALAAENIGGAGDLNLAAPPGWSVLLEGTAAGFAPYPFLVAAIDVATGGEGTAFDVHGDAYAWRLLEVHPLPGAVGHWSAIEGANYSGSPGVYTHTDPGMDGVLWVQTGFANRWYGGGSLPVTNYGGAYGATGVDAPQVGADTMGTIGGWGPCTTQALAMNWG